MTKGERDRSRDLVFEVAPFLRLSSGRAKTIMRHVVKAVKAGLNEAKARKLRKRKQVSMAAVCRVADES
jgi:hypothetical protein